MGRQQFKQLSFDQFILPFDGKLDPENRWIKLAGLTPWFEAEQHYAQNFTAPTGMPAYNVRTALGSLIIKETLCLSDRDLQWCKEHKIRLSGVPLGRPPKEPALQAERKRQIKLDEGIRNTVEGKFGQAKRKFGMQRIKAKLQSTSKTMVLLVIFVMNLQKLLAVHLLRQNKGLLLFYSTKMAGESSL